MSLGSIVFAPLYDRLTRASEEACVADWRAELLAPLAGSVLDVGAGTGANLVHYPAAVTRVTAAEPDRHMRRQLARRIATESLPISVEICDASAERLPMEEHSFDNVVSTLVLCSVGDPARALSEYRRVLRPGGVLVFIEHVVAHDNEPRRRWQRRVEPIWKRLFGNCHLTRDTATAMQAAGFTFEQIQRQSMRKAAPVVRPTIRGVARPAG